MNCIHPYFYNELDNNKTIKRNSPLAFYFLKFINTSYNLIVPEYYIFLVYDTNILYCLNTSLQVYVFFFTVKIFALLLKLH